MSHLNDTSSIEKIVSSLEKDREVALEEEKIQEISSEDAETLTKIADKYYQTKRYSKALVWYFRAASQNNSKAQYQLGEMFYYGESVSHDDRQALYWYLKAANNDGNKEAQFSVGIMYQYRRGVSKHIGTAIQWYTKAAIQDHSSAQYALGWIFENEETVRDLQESVNWYNKAADNGDLCAKYYVKQLNKKGYYPISEKRGKQNIIFYHSNNSAKGDIRLLLLLMLTYKELGRDANETNTDKEQDIRLEQLTSTASYPKNELELIKAEIKKLEQTFQLKIEETLFKKVNLEQRLDILEQESTKRETVLQEQIDTLQEDKLKPAVKVEQFQAPFSDFNLLLISVVFLLLLVILPQAISLYNNQ